MISRKIKEVLKSYPDAVFIGGAAMSLHGLRDTHDVDAWVPNLKNTIKGADLTDSKLAFGEICIGDIHNHYEEILMDDIMVKVMDKETIFIVKTDSARAKDIDDLELLAKELTPESIAKRAGELVKCNNQDYQYCLENLVQELGVHYGCISAATLKSTGLTGDSLEASIRMLTPKTLSRGM